MTVAQGLEEEDAHAYTIQFQLPVPDSAQEPRTLQECVELSYHSMP